MYDIKTFDDLMRFYDEKYPGGGAQFRFMVRRTAISNWRTRGIPGGWHGRIMMDLADAGKTFDPGLFDADGHPGALVLNGRIKGNGLAAPSAA